MGAVRDEGRAVAGPPDDRDVVLLSQRFTADTMTALRHTLTARVAAAGLVGDDRDDFVLAVHELVTNAVRHGGGAGDLALRQRDDVLVCEVRDHGAGAQRLPVELSASDVPGGRGLWLAHRLTGALMLTRRPDGVSASVSMCVTPRTSPTAEPATTTDPAHPLPATAPLVVADGPDPVPTSDPAHPLPATAPLVVADGPDPVPTSDPAHPLPATAPLVVADGPDPVPTAGPTGPAAPADRPEDAG